MASDSRSRTALICGISGQDGAYLARLLLDKGYVVWGSSRDSYTSAFGNLTRVGLRDRVNLVSMATIDFRSVLSVLSRVMPDEIYNLAGQSSVGLSFEQPVETLDSIATATLNLLEAIRFLDKPIRFYNASSSECFGDTGSDAADELTALRPRSPYAVAKTAAFWMVANYREAYGLHASSGLLFNHESPLRPERFVTQKIVSGACRIALGERAPIRLGNLSVRRDWGWAPEFVDAMHRMLQLDCPEDFVIGTGESHSLEDFVAAAFSEVGLDWRNWVEVDHALYRPSELPANRANPEKALRILGWRASLHMHQVVAQMVGQKMVELGKTASAGTAAK